MAYGVRIPCIPCIPSRTCNRVGHLPGYMWQHHVRPCACLFSLPSQRQTAAHQADTSRHDINYCITSAFKLPTATRPATFAAFLPVRNVHVPPTAAPGHTFQLQHGHRCHATTRPRFTPRHGHNVRGPIDASTAQKKPPHGRLRCGGYFLFGYKFHYLLCGFSFSRFQKFCFGKSAVYFLDVLFGLMIQPCKDGS